MTNVDVNKVDRLRTCFTCHKKVRMVVESFDDIIKVYCPICKSIDEMIFIGGDKNGKKS